MSQNEKAPAYSTLNTDKVVSNDEGLEDLSSITRKRSTPLPAPPLDEANSSPPALAATGPLLLPPRSESFIRANPEGNTNAVEIPDTTHWGNTLMALYDYKGTEPGELSFRIGDVVTAVDRSYDNWWRVRRVSDGKTGIIPINYFAPYDSIPTADTGRGTPYPDRQHEAQEEVAARPGPPPTYAVSADRDRRLDRLGEELAPDSTVWLTYVNTATAHDAEMVDGWNKSLDVLLIFASLFSAVVTAFVIESSKLLQPDYAQVNALLTAHMLSALANGGNTSFLTGIPPPAEILAFDKSASVTVVNVVWYAALGFSLASVLVAMLAKQWLNAYMSQQQAEPHGAACERQRRFDGLHKWALPHVMAVLPALLHTALFLFLTGLIIYLWQLDNRVSQTTCVILGVLFVFYFASGTLAVFSSSCPYITPLSQFARSRLPIAGKSTPPSSDLLVSRAMMWLASAKDPKTVSSALQSLAGLRRGFVGYDIEQAESLAKYALDRLRGCFVPEWRHGGTYCLREERQYEASCYARTLMNFVDDSRVDPSTFLAILNEPSLPIFLRLLGSCSNHNMALLALCDYQRLLHRIELTKWLSVRGPNGSHDKQQAGKFVRSAPATENMGRIMKFLSNYIKGEIFLQPFAIEIAVETIGFAPLPWVVAVSTKEPPLEETLLPLFRLLKATRDGILGVRRALARTFAIFAEIHGGDRLPDQTDDITLRFENALSITATIEFGEESQESSRELLLRGLSHFAGTFVKESGELSSDMICEALFHECDKRSGAEDLSFSDKAAVAALLPLLHTPLEIEPKTQILTRLQANAISAAPGYNLAQDSLLYHITPRDPFPPETVSILLTTLGTFKDSTASWLRDTSILLFLVTQESTHKRHLLAEKETTLMIELVRHVASEEVANHLFWILTCVTRETVSASDSDSVLVLASAGVLQLVHDYREKCGLTPADIHAWVDIIPRLPIVPPETITRRELVDFMCIWLETQQQEQSQRLQELREPLLQFSAQAQEPYTVETALQALQGLKASYNYAPIEVTVKKESSTTGFVYPPHAILPMEDFE